MKTVKKLLSLVFGLALLLNVMSVPAMATGTADLTGTLKITITSKTNGHTFQAYQVFAGTVTLSGTTEKLTNITWGAGVNGTNLLTALKSSTANPTYYTSFASCNNASDVAIVIGTLSGTAGFPDTLAKIIANNLTGDPKSSTLVTGTTYNYAISGLTSGYYFINEATMSGTDNAYTKYILELLGSNTTIAAKTDKPAIVKKVKENNHPTYANSWNDAADYNVGDSVPFRIVGLVPDMTHYSTYSFKITDTPSAGLTLDSSSIKVYYTPGSDMYAASTSTATGAGGTLLTSGFTVSGTSPFIIDFADLKATAGVSSNGFIVVEYTATLNSNAVIANSDSSLNTAGNPNEVYLTFSNNPNSGGTGTTPKDEVVVFTYSIPVHKVKGDGITALSGAKFAIFRTQADATAAAADPSSANLTNALKFNGSAGNYVLSPTGSVVSVESTSTGTYAIKGLDQGTYYLVETAAPSGYNRLTTAIKVNLTPTFTAANYVNGHVVDTNDQLTAVNVTNAGTVSTLAVSTDSISVMCVTYDYITVINNAGTTLPETGGIGTTIFTLGGIILMLGAVIVFIAKRKLASQKTER